MDKHCVILSFLAKCMNAEQSEVPNVCSESRSVSIIKPVCQKSHSGAFICLATECTCLFQLLYYFALMLVIRHCYRFRHVIVASCCNGFLTNYVSMAQGVNIINLLGIFNSFISSFIIQARIFYISTTSMCLWLCIA
jgi:hypothetical protein